MLIDLKCSVWFTLGSESETMLFCDTFFRSGIFSKFHKSNYPAKPTKLSYVGILIKPAGFVGFL